MSIKKIRICFLIGYLFLLGTISKAQVANQSAKITSGNLGYLEYLPSDYKTSNKTYPLLIFLHGIDERGNGTTELSKVAVAGPPKEIKNGHPMTFSVGGKSHTFIVLSPQLSTKKGLWGEADVNEIVEHALQSYRVDTCRVYLTGLSLGGGGTWNYSYSKSNAKNKITAIAPIAGFGPNYDPEGKGCIIAKRRIAVWSFHGDKDNVVTIDKDQIIIDAVNNCTNPVASPKALFTIYPGVGHNSWDRAYKTDHTYHNPNVYEWMLSKRKNTCTSLTSMEDEEENNGMNLHYSDLEKKIWLSGSKIYGKISIEIFDILGKSLFKKSDINIEESIVDLASLNSNSSIFLLKVKSNEEEIATFKVLK